MLQDGWKHGSTCLLPVQISFLVNQWAAPLSKSCCLACLAHLIDSQTFKRLLILLLPTVETLRPIKHMELFTRILERKEAPSSNVLLELPSIKSRKLNRRFPTALQTKTLTNIWSPLHAHMPIQTFAGCSAKFTPAELLLPIILFWDHSSLVPLLCTDD